MEMAQQDFRRSTHDDQDINRIRKLWNIKRAALEKKMDANIYDEFKLYYTTELQELYVHNKPKKSGKAQLSTEEANELRERMNNVEHRVDGVEDVQDVHSNLFTTAEIPQTANTVATTLTAETQLKTLLDGLATLIATNKGQNTNQTGSISSSPSIINTNYSNKQYGRTKGGNSKNDTLKQTWRQYTFWCYTCGVNLHHNTIDGCKRVPKREGHNVAVTRDNPGNGNTSRDHLWMKWSFDGKVYPKKME